MKDKQKKDDEELMEYLDSAIEWLERPALCRAFFLWEDTMIEQELNRLLADAKSDNSLKQQLLDTRGSDNPVEDFFLLAQQLGYEIRTGELFALGLTENDAKLRSVNGGGVSPIDGWDDAYEQFFTALIWT